MNKLFTKIATAFVGMAMAIGVGVAVGSKSESKLAKADSSYSNTFDKADIGSGLSGSYTDATSYWKVPASAGNTATISLSFDTTYTPTSAISVSFHIATFGSGTNPSNSNTTITAEGSDVGSTWSGSTVGTYPTSSTFVDGVMTMALKSDVSISGLTITMGVNSSIKIFRLDSITVSFDYAVNKDYTISTSTEGLTLSGDLSVDNGDSAEVLLTTQQKKKITSVTLTGAGTEGENWDYDSSTRTITILEVTSNVTVTATIGDAPVGSIAVSGQKITFNVGESFSFGGIVTATYDDSASVHGTGTLTAENYTIDSSKYNSSSAGTYHITVTSGTAEYKYNVTVKVISGAIASGRYYIFTDNGALENKNYSNSTSTKVNIYATSAWVFTLVDDDTYTISNGSQYLYSTNDNSGLRTKVAATNWTLTALTGGDAGKYSLTTVDASSNVRYLCDFNGSKNDWRTYKSASIGEMYKLYIVEEQTAFANYLTTNFTCSGVTVQNPNGAITAENPATVWSNLSTFKSNLGSSAQNTLKTLPANESGTAVEAALARYDLVIRKYTTSSYSDFLGRFSSGGVNASARIDIGDITNIGNNSATLIIVIIALTGIITIGGYFFYRRRKEQ